MTTHHLNVEGEEFIVTKRPTEARYEFLWVNDNHDPHYGFSKGGRPDEPMSEDEMRTAIENFLADINPETGYLD